MDHDRLFNKEAKKLKFIQGLFRQPHLIIHFQFNLQSHFNVLQTAGKIIAFFAISKFICAILIDQNESGIRKQSKAKLKGSLNVKIGQGIVNICF